ncbi:MFS transporter [Bacillus sp. ISL-47]|uniref:MFS transporter n=1 Tax=Bacillus sp. ISL-47 TaxID=2819130 RepID=UPI001BEB61F0|nr:MFS transporter [Bacillus sp. ISL-47]MBT2688209.1 MFS transporter [Bacillus sp. ISL-47]MBT2708497.1 MFS transporter [Pseudomonas sp. ISL-84]
MALPLSETKQNEKLSIRNGIATTIVLNISNNYFPLFAISVLGATNFQIGLISSLPQFIGMFAMVIGSLIINRLEEKKRFTAYSFLAARLFLFLMFFIMYLPAEYRGWTFVLLVGFMNLPGSFANLSWQSFIGDLIPDERRSGFFSQRNKILTIVGMFSTLLIGLLLQQFDKINPFPFQVLFISAFLFGLIEVYYLLKHKEEKKEKKSENKRLSLGLEVFKHKPFLYFLLCSLFFNFGWQMAWSLFSIYQIKYAGATALWISLFTVANQLAQIVSYKWWGRMADKHSNAKMMVLVSAGMASAPVLTILSPNMIYLVLVNGFSGLFVSGTVLILFNQLLEVTEEEKRSVFISNYNILLALVAFVAPQFGVYLLEQTSIDIAMLVSTILRGSSAGVFFILYLYLKRNKLKTLPAAFIYAKNLPKG